MNWNLKKRITDLYRTQVDFAEVAETNEAQVSRVLNGRRTLSNAEKARWAKLLNCKIKNIFKED